MTKMEGCIFCRIVRGEAERSVVHEDERTIAFMDIKPVTPGHLLVVPRVHAPYLADLDAEDGAQIFRAGQRAAAALRASSLCCDGVNLYVADGAVAGQEVFHLHLHVVPRFRGDGFGLRFPPDYVVRDRAVLEEAACAVRAAWR
jgi:diadenosine tetraphosphate (Ap4A) HIT family hydrolase